MNDCLCISAKYYFCFSQGVEQNFTKQNFLVNKRKRLNTISETKPNTGQLTINYFLLSLQQQSQDLFARLGLSDFAELPFADFYDELIMLSFPIFSLVVFFLQVFWSKFAILFKFFWTKTNNFWTTPSTLHLFQVSLSSLQIFSIAFFSFLELSFFCFQYKTVFFDYLLWFYVHFPKISL